MSQPRGVPQVRVLKEGEAFALHNDGVLEIFFLGCGSAFSRQHKQNNYLIVKGDTHVLVDLGMTGPSALRENAGLGMTDVQQVLVTHSHADHVGGLELLALTNRYLGIPRMGKPKLRLLTTEEYAPLLWSETLAGGLAHNERRPDGTELGLEDYFDLEYFAPLADAGDGRPSFHLTVGSLELELFRTMHIQDSAVDCRDSAISYGLFIDGKVFVSGDTRFDPALIRSYEGRALTLFHDAQFMCGGVHACVEELRRLPTDIKKRMYLMHYGDDWKSHDASEFAGWAKERTVYRFPG
jgi:ribonuclease BN (tRNA processing enzyme)